MQRPRLEVGIYQIADDALMKANRTDGTGWEWGWADWRRDWMDATPNRYAYRCLPLTIVNQTGWWVRNPVGFTATWRGRTAPGTIDFRFDAAGDVWGNWINSQFGEGIITWNTPFLFRTKPEGSRLLVCGPANDFKANAHPLTALIESDWVSMSFTMNWKLMAAGAPVRFEAGDPLFQVIPLVSNACADLESASVTYRRLSDDPEIHRSYNDWQAGRNRFHEQKAKGEVKPDDWQKDYFRGRDTSGREVAPDHMTKVKPPAVRYAPGDPLDPARKARQDPRPEKFLTRTPPDGGGLPGPFASFVTQVHSNQSGDGPVRPEPAFDDEWRRWVAENLLLGVDRDALLSVMVGRGFSQDVAAGEIELAARSPYLQGAERLRNRLT